MLDSPFTFGSIFYSTTKWSKFQTFLLELLCLYFSWYIFVGAGKIFNIKCYLIPSTTTFQLTTTTKKHWRTILFSIFYSICILYWKCIPFDLMKIFTRECLILKMSFSIILKELFMLHISWEFYLYIILGYVLIYVFIYQILWMIFRDVHIQWQQTK